MTLRISREEGPRMQARLRLEGRLVAEWAVFLEHECSELLGAFSAVSLDLTDVSFVDRAGVEALKRLSQVNVEIRCRPGAVASVLEGEGIHLEHEAQAEDDGRS